MPAEGVHERSDLSDDCRLRFRGRRRDSGRSKGLCGCRLPWDERNRCADSAKHNGRDRRSRGAARVRARAARGDLARHRHRWGQAGNALLAAAPRGCGGRVTKTESLFSRPIIEAVADYLSDHPVPLVVDPVMVASSGAKLLQDDAIDALVTRLFPLATAVTPNLHQAQVLASRVRGPGPQTARVLHDA